MVRQVLFALLAIATTDLLFARGAQAALPADVRPPLALAYSGQSLTVGGVPSAASLTRIPDASELGPFFSLSFSVTSVSGNRVTVQTGSGGTFTCIDGSVCSEFNQFWVDPTNPVYYDISGTPLSPSSSCTQGMICMVYPSSATPQISAQFDANSGLLVSYSNLSATFNITAPYPLTVVETGPGSVSSSPSGISCGTTCAAGFSAGTTVTLTPSSAAGASFVGWGGACSGTGGCTLMFTNDAAALELSTMNAVFGVTAMFCYSTQNGNGCNGTGIFLQNVDGDIVTWQVSGTSIIGGGQILNPGPSWHVVGTGDFYNNGLADILFQNEDGDIVIWEISGTSIVGGGEVVNPGPSWHVVGTGDFYGNGFSDILLQNVNGDVVIWEMNGTGIVGGGEVANPDPSWHIAGVADFNADGKSDILLQNASGDVVIWEMSGTSFIGGGEVANPGPSWLVVGTGDFYGNGNSCILLQNENGDVVIWEMNGTSIIGGGEVANPGPAWGVVATGDYNADGITDIMFQNENGQIAIWAMNGTSILPSSGAVANPGPSWHVGS
jgi:hypothetical protein